MATRPTTNKIKYTDGIKAIVTSTVSIAGAVDESAQALELYAKGFKLQAQGDLASTYLEVMSDLDSLGTDTEATPEQIAKAKEYAGL